MGSDAQRLPRSVLNWRSLDLTQLARLAYGDGAQSDTVRQRAVNELWTRVEPDVDRMATRLCADTQLERRCPGPQKCAYGFCAAAQDEVFHRLFTPTGRDSFASLVANDPNLDDDRLWKRVRVLNAGLWDSAKRRVLALNGMPQRVDTLLRTFPHAGCLQSIIDGELGDDRDLFCSYLISVTQLDWLMALSDDSVHESYLYPNEARVLRYLSTRTQAPNPAVEGLGDHHPDRIRIQRAIIRTDKALAAHHEDGCVVCGGLPTATHEERQAEAARELTSAAADIIDHLIATGLVTTGADQQPVSTEGNAALVILAIRFADGRLGKTYRPSWYDRYIGKPRSLFLVGLPSSNHDESRRKRASEDMPEWTDEVEYGGDSDA